MLCYVRIYTTERLNLIISCSRFDVGNFFEICLEKVSKLLVSFFKVVVNYDDVHVARFHPKVHFFLGHAQPFLQGCFGFGATVDQPILENVHAWRFYEDKPRIQVGTFDLSDALHVYIQNANLPGILTS